MTDNRDSEVVQLLERAVDSGDPSDVEGALSVSFNGGGGAAAVPLLARLLVAYGHNSHEDIALVLQWRRDPRAVEALGAAALMKHDYLAFDNSYAFARKCTWALADIGTPEAQAKLRLLAANSDETIAGYAQKRLDNWEDELSRKTGPRR
jgi:hypothetical protein